jgi:hypothetical protein
MLIKLAMEHGNKTENGLELDLVHIQAGTGQYGRNHPGDGNTGADGL